MVIKWMSNQKTFFIAIFLVIGLVACTFIQPPEAKANGQSNFPALETIIILPEDGQTFLLGTKFIVVAEVQNIGVEGDIYNAKLTISINGNAMVLDEPVKTVAAVLTAGAKANTQWTVQCTGVGPVIITVSPYGQDYLGTPIPQRYLIPDSITILQLPLKIQDNSSSYLPKDPRILIVTVSAQPQQTSVSQPVTIYTNVANRGDLAGDYNVNLKINGQIAETIKGRINGNTAIPLKFTVYSDTPGIYNVDINGQKSYFIVTDDAGNKVLKPREFALIGFIMCAISIVVVSVLIIMRRRSIY